MLQQFSPNAKKNFLARIEQKSDDECWNLIGGKPNENGAVSIRINENKTSKLKPYKVAFELLKHEIPEGYELIQTCGNPMCCNLAHTQLQSLTTDHFWTKVDKSPGLGPQGTCWEWRGGLNAYGYGNFAQSRKVVGNTKKRLVTAHIYSYRISKGEIPKGLCVCHKCDNRLCVNPDHLWLGTLQENARDRHEKGRTKNGVFIGEENGSAKLTEADVKLIRQALQQDVSYAELGRRFNVTPPTISLIDKQKTWKHI